MKLLRSHIVVTFILMLGVGFGIGTVASPLFAGTDVKVERERHSGVSATGLTNPLLECDLGQEYLSENSIRPFREVIESEISGLVAKKKASHISYYFRDLNNGSWFGFNEKEQFTPASMFKVPLLMYVQNLAETNPAILDEKIGYERGAVNSDEFFSTGKAIEVGKIYSVRELLDYMIFDSDNNATALLLNVVGFENSQAIFKDLGVPLTIAADKTVSMSVRDYAGFYRVLFNASYLSKHASEQVLSILTQTKFDKGIVAGVPQGVVVAHKFGERGGKADKQIHDCGIVYTGKSPYLLCIMTRGTDFNDLASVISDLSRTTYETVEAQKK